MPGSGRLRPKPCRLARHAELRWRVAQKLALQWSPEQISGWLKRQFPADQGMQISYETIYRSLFIQTRGVLKKELMAHLRTARQMRQAKGGTTKSGLGQIVDTVSIRERPAEVEDRAVPGHWEGDLFSGANNTHIATLNSARVLEAHPMLSGVAGPFRADVEKDFLQKITPTL